MVPTAYSSCDIWGIFIICSVRKGRDSQTWFVNGFLFSLVALLAICGVPSVKSSEAKAEHVEKKIKEELDLTFD